MTTRRAVIIGASWIVTIGVPLLLILGSVRLAMTPQYLSFAYQRPDLRDDPYGFTREDRLRYGPIGIEYLITDADISLLGNLEFPNGGRMYTERELGHMEDVKDVTVAAFRLLAVALVLVPGCATFLWLTNNPTRLWGALRMGALLTLSGIAAVVISAVIAWDMFFSLFHRLFFADGTWIFYTSDTLIRLYPEQFWFDTALLIGGVVIGGALIVVFISHRLLMRAVVERGGQG